MNKILYIIIIVFLFCSCSLNKSIERRLEDINRMEYKAFVFSGVCYNADSIGKYLYFYKWRNKKKKRLETRSFTLTECYKIMESSNTNYQRIGRIMFYEIIKEIRDETSKDL